MSDNEVVLWGRGGLMRKTLECFPSLEPRYIVDGLSQCGCGDKYDDYRVLSKKEFFSVADKNKKVVVVSSFFHQIVPSLLNFGFDEGNIFIAFESGDEVSIECVTDLEYTIDDYREAYDRYQSIVSGVDAAGAKAFSSRLRVLEYAFEAASNTGLVLEFGVYKGESIRFLSSMTEGNVYGFDSFEGLPENWRPGARESTFSLNGQLPNVPGNVVLVKGWFEDSLNGFLSSHAGPVSFLHMDADLYSSTRYVLDRLKARLFPGSVIVFDEMFTHLDPDFGEYRAYEDWCKESNIKCKFISRSNYSAALVVESL